MIIAATKSMNATPPATLPAMIAVLSEEDTLLTGSLRVVGIDINDYKGG